MDHGMPGLLLILEMLRCHSKPIKSTGCRKCIIQHQVGSAKVETRSGLLTKVSRPNFQESVPDTFVVPHDEWKSRMLIGILTSGLAL